MATVAIYSLKGGVGKTTLAVNLAWTAAVRSARRTLLWDLDPQAASGWMLGVTPRGEKAHALFARDIAAAKLIRPTGVERLDLLPADASLRELDHLFRELDKKKRLHKLIASLGAYDRVILDCPPGLTETADQVARAADLIVIPVVPSPLAERAYDEVLRHLGGRTPVLPVHAMVDRRRKLHADALARNPEWPVIPMASIVESAAAKHRAVGDIAPRAPAAAAFADLWQRIENVSCPSLRRARPGDGTRRLFGRGVPDGRRTRCARRVLGRAAATARSCRSTDSICRNRCAGRCCPTGSASPPIRHSATSCNCVRRAPTIAPKPGSTARSSTSSAGSTPQAMRIRSNAGTATTWSAGCTGWRWAARSSAKAWSAARPTRRRSRWPRSSLGCAQVATHCWTASS